MNIEYTNRNSPIRSNFVQADSDMPIRYPVPSPLDFLVGFLDVGRHLDSTLLKPAWSQNRTLRARRSTPA
ncbi:unnamed protein product [Rhizophagus irregularis]|nr:unnamed protein product [Rhizophagus irregularis]